jgi:cob(I)alamin adenosyltransferase
LLLQFSSSSSYAAELVELTAVLTGMQSMQHFPQEVRALARRIERLPAAVQREMHARAVMTVVNKLTHRHLRGHALLY